MRDRRVPRARVGRRPSARPSVVPERAQRRHLVSLVVALEAGPLGLADEPEAITGELGYEPVQDCVETPMDTGFVGQDAALGGTEMARNGLSRTETAGSTAGSTPHEERGSATGPMAG